FLVAFNSGGVDSARPFLGNLSAPQTSVGIFCGELGGCPGGLADTQLISLNALNDPNNPSIVPVTKDQVRFILNAGFAQSVFGTPFGNTPRNPVQDAISNVANASVLKKIRVSEHNSFEFRASAQNVFNHPNFNSVDPFIDDAGLFDSFTGFGDPKTTGTAYPGFNGATRRFNVGLTFRF
ncbi:MAG TPA: hypothetical protein VJV96_15375, partial [Candidatus Angelobacter sp.]|nr:hypothetical protein [Candidatus Angelobacter sp.]